MIGIYKIENPKGKIYIGSSNNIEKRIKYYSSLNCKGQQKLFNSIKKYGWKSHKLTIICECEEEQLFELECFYGNIYNVLCENGLNLVLPKSGDIKIGISDETRKKMSESKKGNKNTFYGKKHSIESKQKIRLFQTGRKHTEEHRKKVSLNNAKNLSKIVLDFNTGVYYNSAKEVSELYGINHSTLRSQLNGSNKNKTQFKYV